MKPTPAQRRLLEHMASLPDGRMDAARYPERFNRRTLLVLHEQGWAADGAWPWIQVLTAAGRAVLQEEREP